MYRGPWSAYTSTVVAFPIIPGKLLMITVTVNGNPFELEAAVSIRELLRVAEVPPNYLAVEVNAEVIPRESHESYLIQAGDQIEVVTLVGGG